MKNFLVFIFLFAGMKAFCQDSSNTLKSTPDTTAFKTKLTFIYKAGFNYIYHFPDKKDEQRYKKYKYLIGKKPTSKNHELYYSLACSLWDLKKITEAEQMFLTIINSDEKYYSSTYYHSSDIPGDTSSNIYGYGSFTSNYKNHSAIYLTKIYIEQKKFDKALQYLNDAVKKYKVAYNCGTGYYSQKNEYNFLYASCYLGLRKYKEVIDLLLPDCLDRNDTIIISAIRNTYSKNEIREYLEKAENSITCSLDTFPTYAYRMKSVGNKFEYTDTLEYYSGSATILLFDKAIAMPVPRLDHGQHMTKEMFLTLFKESDFYFSLNTKK